MIEFILYFLLAVFLSLALTPVVKKLAWRWACVDMPNLPRKIHTQPTPLLGGLAVYLSVSLAMGAYLLFGRVDFLVIPLKFFLAIPLGGSILMLGGFLDDKYRQPPKILWIFPAVAAVVVVMSGIGVGITHITNPFGQPFSLAFRVLGIQASAIFVWVWLMGMMFTTKFLDGLDGLTSGIAFIAGLTLFFLSLNASNNQTMTATLAIIFCGSLLGYLFYNFHPAQIFFGEGGSTFAGFVLGLLAVILGAKIATALLVMGVPILDVAWVIVRRLWYKSSPFRADRKHLHFRLLDLGFSQKQTVLILYALSALFGFTAIFLQSLGKLVALVVLFMVMIVLAISVVMLYKRKHPHIPGQ